MKKIIIIIVFIFISIYLNKDEKELRVRIIAASNNEEDIIIKNKIKERLEEDFLYKDYDYDEYIEYLNDSLIKINESLNEICECKVTLEEHIFLNKTYNFKEIENEECLTLLIVIKEGNGNNWWTTLYPFNDEKSDTIYYKSWFLERINDDDN